MQRKRRITRYKRSSSFTAWSPKYQLRRTIWVFHQYDEDPFPSIPHGHSIDGRYKLNVDNGYIYKGTDVTNLRLSPKEYNRLLNDPLYIKLATIAKKFHEELNSNKPKLKSRRHLNYRFVFECSVEKYE